VKLFEEYINYKDGNGKRDSAKYYEKCYKQQDIHQHNHCKFVENRIYPCFHPGCGKCYATRNETACKREHSEKYKKVKIPVIPKSVSEEARKEGCGQKRKPKSEPSTINTR